MKLVFYLGGLRAYPGKSCWMVRAGKLGCFAIEETVTINVIPFDTYDFADIEVSQDVWYRSRGDYGKNFTAVLPLEVDE